MFRRSRIVVAAVVIVTVLAFLPAVGAPFFFDDYPGIVENPSIARLWPLSGALHPTDNTPFSNRPIANVSLAVNHAVNQAFGVGRGHPRETVGYHTVSLALHVANGLLLIYLIAGICRRRYPEASAWLPVAAGAIWLVHPVQTEAVNYLSQRTELLVSLFLLATLAAWSRSGEEASASRRLAWRLAAFTFCSLGMGAKESMVVAPLLIILYDRAFATQAWREVFSRRRAWWYAAFGLAAVARLATLDSRFQSVGFGLGLTWWEYFYSQCWAIARYLQLALWPDRLTLDYGMAPVRDWRGVPGLLLLLGLGAGTLWAWTRANRWGWLGFAGAWFFLILAPSSSFVPITTEIAAERRFYLPLAAIVVTVVVGLSRTARTAREQRKRVALFAGMATAILAAVTFQVSGKYRDPERLWREAAERRPNNPRALTNLAVMAYQRDPSRTDSAVTLLRRAIAIDSNDAAAWFRLGQIAMNQRRGTEAEASLRRALSIDPHHRDALAAYGRLLYLRGDAKGAVDYLRQAADPPAQQPLFDLARAHIAAGEIEPAIAALTAAARLEPPRPDIEAFLGALLVEARRPADAVPFLEAAARHEPRVAAHKALLSVALAQANRATEALAAADAALRGGNGDPGVYVLVGRTLLILNKREAEAVLAEAARLAPSDPEALTLLGHAHLAAGDRVAAAGAFRRALSVSPGYAPALQGLATLRNRG